MFSFGEELRRERERRGLDLGRIAQATNIPRRFLMAIESGRVQSIPGRFYRRAYIRAYAHQLGLDPDRFLAAYEFGASGEAQAQASSDTHAGSSLVLANAVKWVAVGIIGLGLTGAAAAVWRRAPESPPSTLGDVAAIPATGPRSENVSTGPALPFVDGEFAPEGPGPTLVRLTLTVNEPCWLEVSIDGERAIEGIMLRGFEKEFLAEEICFSLGNAGGVSYRIDDRAGKPLGESGQVIKGVCVTPENVLDFVDQETEGARVG